MGFGFVNRVANDVHGTAREDSSRAGAARRADGGAGRRFDTIVAGLAGPRREDREDASKSDDTGTVAASSGVSRADAEVCKGTGKAKADGDGGGVDSGAAAPKSPEAEAASSAAPEGAETGGAAQAEAAPAQEEEAEIDLSDAVGGAVPRSMGDLAALLRSDGGGKGGATPKADDPAPPAPAKTFPIKAKFNLTTSITNDYPADPFGTESADFKLVNVQAKKKNGVITLSGTINLNCRWGVAGGGNIDVPSGDSDVVTTDEWEAIRDDLMPSEASPHKSPRSTYWSKALTERHEQYHAKDDVKWTKSTGKAMMMKYIEGYNMAFSQKALTTIKDMARDKIEAASLEYYYGGSSDPGHSNRAGEIRAYGDGKGHYTKLAKAVAKRGKKLQKKAAKENGKKKKK